MALTGRQALEPVLHALDERWWLRHGLFWTVRTLLLLWLFLYVLHLTPHWQLALRDTLLLLPPHLLVVYSLLYGVLPPLWRDAQPGRFLVLMGAWIVGGLAVTFAHRYYVLVPMHLHEVSPFPDYHVAFATGAHLPLLLTAGVAACLHVYRQWHRQALNNAQLTQENYQSELQLLRAQIHPHFLFNTLNNLYALTLRQSEQAPLMVERLTALLRFVLKQGNCPLVALPDEVELLRSYLALQQLRYGTRLTLELHAPDMPATGRIAPLLLLPLVENAFKHGSAEQLGQARISIALAVQDGWFSCVITNTRNQESGQAAGPEGIGLRNVRQRLQLLYPQQHVFSVEPDHATFTVRLRVALWLVPQSSAISQPLPEAAWPTTRQPTAWPAPAQPLVQAPHA